MSSVEEIREERLRKLAVIKDSGLLAYPNNCRRDRSISKFLDTFDELSQKGSLVTLAGRIMALRAHGGSTFFDIFDGSGRVQALIRKDEIGEGNYNLFGSVTDSSDFIELTGIAYVTKRGEKSILAKEWKMLSKSLRPIPDEWYGLKDEDERLRKRYIDVLLNDDVADMVRKRSIFWNSIREYLLKKDFIEVETPVLENMTGGAEARPFVTHHNALDIDVFLRISAGELWQKKLMVAGLPRTFEIGRIFRNEGMSSEHLQDYTQLEFYMAYSDYRQGMEVVKDLYRTIARATFGTTEFTIKDQKIDLADEWKIYDYCDLIREAYGIDPLTASVHQVKDALQKAGIDYGNNTLTLERGIDHLWKKIRKSIAGPGFLVGVPVFMEPLAKRSSEDDRIAERFQVMLAGSEMGKGFSELNDPVDQSERFAHQQVLRDAGDEEAQMADMEFVEAIEYGMPPTFGFGLSERLFSFLIDKPIREGQIFPLMKPR